MVCTQFLPFTVLNNLDQWGGICTTGTRQSPIDLSRSVSQSSAFPNLVFDSNQTYDVTLEIGHDGLFLQNKKTPSIK